MIQSLYASDPDGLRELNIKAPFSQLESRFELSEGLIADLRPFTDGLKRKLDRVLNTAADLDSLSAEEYLITSLRQILSKENKKYHELLALEVLERAILLHQVMMKETAQSDVHQAQVRIRLLTRAIDLVREKYFKQDQSFLNNERKDIQNAKFATDYFQYLTNLNKSIFDSSAQYRIEKLSLQFLAYDLARDEYYQSYANTIVEVNDSLIGFSSKYSNDQRYLEGLRSLRKIKGSVLSTMDKSYELINRSVFIKGALLSGDKEETIYTGEVISIATDKTLVIDWKRRDGHLLDQPYRQSHNRNSLTFNSLNHTNFKEGQIVSKFDFHSNGTRFTKTGRLIQVFENKIASVLWTNTSAYL